VTNEEEHVTDQAEAPDTERTDDAAFSDDATEKLGDATERETNEQAGEEDGSSPDEPQPETFPPADDEAPDDGGGDDPAAAS
jgi:hypothetical protein